MSGRAAMRRHDPYRLDVKCTADFALLWLFARLERLERDDPRLTIDVRPAADDAEDVNGMSDVELRFVFAKERPFVTSALRSAEFARTQVIPVASREYLSERWIVRHPLDLLAHKLLHEPTHPWESWFVEHGVNDELDLRGPRLWQCPLTVNAARHGLGIALVNRLMVADDLDAGTLVEVGAGLRSFMPKSNGHWHFICRADRWESHVIAEFRRRLALATAQ
jgi:DNA-binding transcriptional LysR family regulator